MGKSSSATVHQSSGRSSSSGSSRGYTSSSHSGSSSGSGSYAYAQGTYRNYDSCNYLSLSTSFQTAQLTLSIASRTSSVKSGPKATVINYGQTDYSRGTPTPSYGSSYRRS
ncbi:hypothetical protein VHEMI04796 [[Torrubiella] hemipterigena]|uniref:Uncharacterized protein n=1 Tax=[Torrubiella] hemipterigena TaxID=1531966 RepID=A0A0A1TEW3_9HYPO|nr:hypothetical protein VHEMI04796 [[Torrubiella] hemipterigena]